MTQNKPSINLNIKKIATSFAIGASIFTTPNTQSQSVQAAQAVHRVIVGVGEGTGGGSRSGGR